jgi:hypothetical protein
MITRWLLALLFAASFAAFAANAAPASAPVERLQPRDEASQDPSFVVFRTKLHAIVQAKDVRGLRSTLAEDILNNFGGGKGIDAFNNAWRPDDPQSAVWPVLAGVLKLGGSFKSRTAFTAPYVSATWPGDLGKFDFVAVTSADAVIRKAPDARSAVVRKLDHDLLEVIQSDLMPQHEAGPDNWDEVKDRKGTRGFILVRDVRSPLDFRATFEKRNGRWVIASFMSGE